LMISISCAASSIPKANNAVIPWPLGGHYIQGAMSNAARHPAMVPKVLVIDPGAPKV
jgi:hypothetical protein